MGNRVKVVRVLSRQQKSGLFKQKPILQLQLILMLNQKVTRVQQLMLALVALIGFVMYDNGNFGGFGVHAQTPNQGMPTCEYNKFPIYYGGSSNEKVGCFIYDPKTEYFIIGGNTTSEDFAPAQNNHGFLIAVDLDANWQWGKFFYNMSYAVSEISGCRMSSDGSSLSLMGQGNSLPLYMEVKTDDGSVLNFISIFWYAASDVVVPVYQTQAGIFNDKIDYFDKKEYVYWAFLKDSAIQMMRVRNLGADAGNPIMDWSFSFDDFTVAQATDHYRKKDPVFLHDDPQDQSSFYLSGYYQGSGSIMKFQKRNAQLRWWLNFPQMTRINSISQVGTEDQFYACGHYWVNEATTETNQDTSVYQTSAVIMKVRNNGEVLFYMNIAGTNPVSTKVSNDECWGISSQKDGTFSVVLSIKMSEIRSATKGDFKDILLIKFNNMGLIESDAVVFTQGTLAQSMILASNGLVQIQDQYFFAGQSIGFKTQLQTLLYTKDILTGGFTSTVKTDLDGFMYRHVFGRARYDCTYTSTVKATDIQRRITTTSGGSVLSSGLAALWQTDDKVPKTRLPNTYHVPFASRYSGGFALQDSFKIPRPCAFKSFNMTTQEYYRGQKPLPYNIGQNNAVSYVTSLMSSPELVLIDGTPADAIAVWNNKTKTVNIQTNSEDDVRPIQVILRDCNAFERLLELNLYIKVLANSYPAPISDIQTSFTMDVGDVLTYRIPQLVDPEGNDTPECYVGIMNAQSDKFPPFLMYENATQTVILRPNSTQVQGRIYYFEITVKEKNSDTVSYPYFCTVKINGEIVEVDYTIRYNDINYTLTWVDNKYGSIKFNRPVNMTWLAGTDGNGTNFNQMFKYYWTDTDYNINKIKQTFKDFEVTNWGEQDQMTINFTMTFAKPYIIGLLKKKSDKLAFELRVPYEGNEDFYAGLFLTNATETRLFNTNSTKTMRMNIIFDFQNPVMNVFRQVASKMYWVLIGLIIVQFFALAARGVGLLPVFILVEYLQLVAFMPIYNFTLIPYLYDAFKPALISHLIIFDETPFLPNLDKQFFNINYFHYKLSVGKLAQATVGIFVVITVVVVSNFVIFLMTKCFKTGRIGDWSNRVLQKYKANAYIRAYMFCYFDATFFSLMKIMEDNNSTGLRKALLLLSYVLFIISIILPVFLITLILRRFEILKIKEAKQSFNTLLLKLDKSGKWRILNPAYFFARRLLTAILLTLPVNNTFIFLQYVFILMSSHAYILYMVAVKPFQTAGINSYVLANETFYSALIIAIFIFSDATPERNIKFGAGVALISSLILLVVSNILTNLIFIIQGPEKLKQAINESKLKRAEKEALERAEEEERKLKKKKEEEEFTKLHDETTNLSNVDAAQGTSTIGNTTLDHLNTKGSKKRKGKSKQKGNDDNLAEGGLAGVQDDDFNPKSKHRSKKGGGGKDDKEKAKQDDVIEGNMGGGAFEDDKKPVKEGRGKKRKSRKNAENTKTTGTGTGGATGTDLNTQQHPNTDKDFI